MAPMNARLLRPLASGRFDPRRITGLQLWLDGQDSSTVLNSISPDAAATTGQTVRRWLDKSGNSRHAEQATGANQPTLSSGRRIDFNGTNHILEITSPGQMARNVGQVAMFAAYNWITSPTVASIFLCLGTNNPAGVTRSLLGGGTVSGRFRIGGRRLDADVLANVSSAGVIATGQTVIHSGLLNYSSATASMRINGAVDGSSSTFQTAGNTSDTDSAFASVGALFNSFGNVQFCNVAIGEVLVYSGSTLASQEVEAIERYLAQKWAVTMA
jgi:hypothetical protein